MLSKGNLAHGRGYGPSNVHHRDVPIVGTREFYFNSFGFVALQIRECTFLPLVEYSPFLESLLQSDLDWVVRTKGGKTYRILTIVVDSYVPNQLLISRSDNPEW